MPKGRVQGRVYGYAKRPSDDGEDAKKDMKVVGDKGELMQGSPVNVEMLAPLRPKRLYSCSRLIARQTRCCCCFLLRLGAH